MQWFEFRLMDLRAAASAAPKSQSNQNPMAALHEWASADRRSNWSASCTAALAVGNAAFAGMSLEIGNRRNDSAIPAYAIANSGSSSVALRKYAIAFCSSANVTFAW